MERNIGKCSNGATLVEFAVSLPLFLMLVFGIIDFSRAFTSQAILSDALRQAGRFGSIQQGDCVAGARTVFVDRLSQFAMQDDATLTGQVVTISGGIDALELHADAPLLCILCNAFFNHPRFHDAALFPLETQGSCSSGGG